MTEQSEHDAIAEGDRDKRWWIIEPIRHREYEAAQPKPETAAFMGLPNVPIIYAESHLAPDEWVCDFCNGDIVVRVNDVVQIIPMLGSNALCQRCMVQCMTRAEQTAFQDETWNPSMWSPKGCGCPPCRETAEEIKKEAQA